VSTDVLPIADRVTNAVASYAKYLGRTFWPVELTVLYPHPSLSFGASFRWSSGQIALGSALLALISVIALISSRRQPWVIVGWLWFVGMLVPVIGLVQVGEQAMADRYTYLPLTGVFIAIVWTAREWLGSERWGRKALTILGIAAITAASILTREQLAYWKNDIALFSHALEINPRNPAAQFGLAQGLVKVGDEAEAIALLQAAIQELPHSTEIHQTLGIAFLKLGRWVEAAHEFRTVLSISPGHANALDGLTTVSIRHGGELLKSGRTNDAAGFLSASLTVQSDFVQRCLSSSRTLARSGSFEGAIDRARLATWLAPGNADAHELLGILLAQNGQVDESITEFRSAIRLNPDQLFALNNLAWILSTSADPGLRNGPEAITLARRACDLTGFKQPVFLGTLSTALAEAGHFSEAIKTAETARDLAMALGNQKLVQMGERLIELYQTNTPFRELRAPSNKSTSVQRP
jgi:Flp pilus assembly protein TadD